MERKEALNESVPCCTTTVGSGLTCQQSNGEKLAGKKLPTIEMGAVIEGDGCQFLGP